MVVAIVHISQIGKDLQIGLPLFDLSRFNTCVYFMVAEVAPEKLFHLEVGVDDFTAA